MHEFRFVWDIRKAESNVRKHGVSFEEAQTAFYDPNASEFYDPSHSDLEEDRFLFLGLSIKRRLLLICHCYRENDKEIRIINARKATKKEAEFYIQRG